MHYRSSSTTVASIQRYRSIQSPIQVVWLARNSRLYCPISKKLELIGMNTIAKHSMYSSVEELISEDATCHTLVAQWNGLCSALFLCARLWRGRYDMDGRLSVGFVTLTVVTSSCNWETISSSASSMALRPDPFPDRSSLDESFMSLTYARFPRLIMGLGVCDKSKRENWSPVRTNPPSLFQYRFHRLPLLAAVSSIRHKNLAPSFLLSWEEEKFLCSRILCKITAISLASSSLSPRWMLASSSRTDSSQTIWSAVNPRGGFRSFQGDEEIFGLVKSISSSNFFSWRFSMLLWTLWVVKWARRAAMPDMVIVRRRCWFFRKNQK